MAVTETLRPPVQQEVLRNPVLRFMTPLGEMRYDRRSQTALSPLLGEPTQLPHTQAVTFEALITQPESTFTYEELAMTIWGISQPSQTDMNAIRTGGIMRLRAKLGDKPLKNKGQNPCYQLIHTIPYVGYSLTNPALGWEHFKSKEILSCETIAGELRLRLPEMTAFSPLTEQETQLLPLEFALLKSLVVEPNRVHEYAELLREAWDVFLPVSEKNVHMLRERIRAVRVKLGDDGLNPRLIYNVLDKVKGRRGYLLMRLEESTQNLV